MGFFFFFLQSILVVNLSLPDGLLEPSLTETCEKLDEPELPMVIEAYKPHLLSFQ